MKFNTDILIIGAGLSGLVAANAIQSNGYMVTVLEKEALVGGQLATQQIKNGLADFGAQFFSCRSKTFQHQVNAWLNAGLLYVWSNEWSDGSLKRSAPDAQARYAVTGGMYQLSLYLADKLHDLRSDVSVRSIQWQGNHWLVTDENDTLYTSRILILTPPVPISLALLDSVPLKQTDRNELERIYYSPCLCGLFTVKGQVGLSPSGAIQNFGRDVYWIADNKTKGISPIERIITMQLNKRYSEQHYDDDDEDTLRYLRSELQPYLKAGAVIETQELKKWRYSVPLTTYPHDILKAEALPLIFSGAAFGGRGRIEGAYLSGQAAARESIKIIGSKTEKNIDVPVAPV